MKRFLHKNSFLLYACALILKIKKIALFSIAIFSVVSSLAQTYKWDNVAMGGGGFVAGIITSKKDPNVVYTRTDVGGAYRWDNNNSKWIPLLDWISISQGGYMGVESIAIDPNNSATIYMLVGTIYTNNGSTAILKSTDNGANFSVLDVTNQFKTHGNGSGRGNGERLQVDPNNGNDVWCGTRQNGLQKSANGGASWTKVDALPVTSTKSYYSGIGTGISFVLLDSASGTISGATKNMYIGVATVDSTNNLYVSKDGGISFTPIPHTGGPDPSRIMPIRAALGTNGSLYITYDSMPGPGDPVGNSAAIWKYNTISSVWTNITPATGLGYGGVSVDPKNPLRLIVSTANTYRPQYVSAGGIVYGDRFYLSADGGTTWRNLIPTNNNNVNITLDPNGVPWITGQSIHWASSIEFNPFNTNQAWVNSGNGIYFCNDLSAMLNTWKFVAQGIEETVPNDMVSIPGGPMFSVIGDYDGFKHLDPTQYPTTGRYSPSMGTSNGITYASLNTNKLVRVGGNMFYSNDQGVSWTQTTSISGTNGKVALSSDGSIILHCPASSSITYRSINNGTNWTACNGISISAAIPVADPVNANKFYAYNNSNGVMYVSTDGGANFSVAGSPGIGGSKIIRTVPGNSGDLWIAMGNGLKRSIDGGITFVTMKNVSACSSVGIGKAANATSYCSIYIWGTINGVTGIFRSIDAGVSWTRVNDDAHQYGGAGNGQFVMGDMNVFGRVYMSTAGRGIAYGEQIAGAVISPPPIVIDSSFSIRLFPNPAVNNTVIVTINLKYTQNIILRFTSFNGTNVITKRVTALPGSNKISINEMRKEPAGAYILSAYSEATGNLLSTIKFLKQ